MAIMHDLTQEHFYDLAKKLVLKKTLLENVVGFTDTLPLLQFVMPNRPKFSQTAIVEDVLESHITLTSHWQMRIFFADL